MKKIMKKNYNRKFTKKKKDLLKDLKMTLINML